MGEQRKGRGGEDVKGREVPVCHLEGKEGRKSCESTETMEEKEEEEEITRSKIERRKEFHRDSPERKTT
eukprot:764825-Hanusia_phi.AAC.1